MQGAARGLVGRAHRAVSLYACWATHTTSGLARQLGHVELAYLEGREHLGRLILRHEELRLLSGHHVLRVPLQLLHTNVALLDVVIDLFVHIGQAALEQARVPIVLDAERLDLLPLHELELLQLITLHLLLVQDLLDLTNLLLQCLNVSLFGHECLAQITNSLFVQLE